MMRPTGARRLSAAIAAGAMAIAAVSLAPRPAAADTPWLSVSEDGYASFTVPAAYIEANAGQVSQVVIEGNFGPSSTWAEFGLTRRGDVWSGVLGPLKAGLYSYQVTGDDTKGLKDPTNGAGVVSKPLWSTFLVAGDSARLLADAPQGQGGKVETLTYQVKKKERSALVWTPPGYQAGGPEDSKGPDGPKSYPALFLQSGEGQSATDWLDLGRAKQIFDNLSARGSMEPMVVVISGGDGPADDKELKDLRTAVADKYHVLRDPAHQAVAGVSEGGTRALRAALTKPNEFAYAGSFSGLLTESAGRPDAKAINRGLKLVRLYT
ncbi:alpha/beta hydrolase, partial [Microbispora sitophila]|uniref:alpha/beta hydrolase n=1 Tax=Microbispora sitophila TaxID=2771537 RepID=UPI0021F6A108